MAKRKPKIASEPVYEFSAEAGHTSAKMSIKCNGEYYFNFRVQLRNGVPILVCWDESYSTVYFPLRKTTEETFGNK